MAKALAKEESSLEKREAHKASQKKGKDYIGMLLVVIAIANGAALAGLGYWMQKMWQNLQQVQKQISPETKHQEETEKTASKELKPLELGTLVPLDTFLVNIASEEGTKYLQVRLELELSDQKLEDEVGKKKSALRDSIIVLLTSKSFRQLRERQALKRLRSEIKDTINRILTTGQVTQVYFTLFHFN